MITNLNLSLSSACSANCIFCPFDRGQRIKVKHMTFRTLKKVIDEAASKPFRKQHNIQLVELGENGDCFLNPDIVKIARYIRKKLPYSRIEVFTNFSNFNSEISQIFIAEKLINSLWFNIDGKNGVNYYHVKGLDLKIVMRNLVDFLNHRTLFKSDIKIVACVCTLHDYIHTIHKHFGLYPIKLKDKSLVNIPDDFEEIKQFMIPLLRPGTDKIGKIKSFSWAEREKILEKGFSQNLECPMMETLKTNAYIAPDGSWYACCLDSNNENIFGNINNESLNDIYFGKKRAEFLRLIQQRKYNEIGGPCRTVSACIRIQ